MTKPNREEAASDPIENGRGAHKDGHVGSSADDPVIRGAKVTARSAIASAAITAGTGLLASLFTLVGTLVYTDDSSARSTQPAPTVTITVTKSAPSTAESAPTKEPGSNRQQGSNSASPTPTNPPATKRNGKCFVPAPDDGSQALAKYTIFCQGWNKDVTLDFVSHYKIPIEKDYEVPDEGSFRLDLDISVACTQNNDSRELLVYIRRAGESTSITDPISIYCPRA